VRIAAETFGASKGNRCDTAVASFKVLGMEG
jgi:hypothetical protein